MKEIRVPLSGEFFMLIDPALIGSYKWGARRTRGGGLKDATPTASRMGPKSATVYAHRVVMEAYFERPLKSWERVSPPELMDDGVTLDCRLRSLQLLSGRDVPTIRSARSPRKQREGFVEDETDAGGRKYKKHVAGNGADLEEHGVRHLKMMGHTDIRWVASKNLGWDIESISPSGFPWRTEVEPNGTIEIGKNERRAMKGRGFFQFLLLRPDGSIAELIKNPGRKGRVREEATRWRLIFPKEKGE